MKKPSFIFLSILEKRSKKLQFYTREPSVVLQNSFFAAVSFCSSNFISNLLLLRIIFTRYFVYLWLLFKDCYAQMLGRETFISRSGIRLTQLFCIILFFLRVLA